MEKSSTSSTASDSVPTLKMNLNQADSHKLPTLQVSEPQNLTLTSSPSESTVVPWPSGPIRNLTKPQVVKFPLDFPVAAFILTIHGVEKCVDQKRQIFEKDVYVEEALKYVIIPVEAGPLVYAKPTLGRYKRSLKKW